MAVTESAKHRLYTYLVETMGDERATTLMELASPAGWADVATKQDVKHEIALLRTELKSEIAELRTEVKGDIAELRTELKGDIGSLRAELKGDMAELRAEVKGDIGSLRNEFTATMERGLRTQLHSIYVFNGIFMSLAVGLAQAIN